MGRYKFQPGNGTAEIIEATQEEVDIMYANANRSIENKGMGREIRITPVDNDTPIGPITVEPVAPVHPGTGEPLQPGETVTWQDNGEGGVWISHFSTGETVVKQSPAVASSAGNKATAPVNLNPQTKVKRLKAKITLSDEFDEEESELLEQLLDYYNETLAVVKAVRSEQTPTQTAE
jgi:hypothetical protein